MDSKCIMTVPTIWNYTGRRTESNAVKIDDIILYFSYETLIAIRSHRVVARLANNWGPTTGRHFKDIGIGEDAIVDDEAFARIVSDEITSIVTRKTRARMLDAA